LHLEKEEPKPQFKILDNLANLRKSLYKEEENKKIASPTKTEKQQEKLLTSKDSSHAFRLIKKNQK